VTSITVQSEITDSPTLIDFAGPTGRPSAIHHSKRIPIRLLKIAQKQRSAVIDLSNPGKVIHHKSRIDPRRADRIHDGASLELRPKFGQIISNSWALSHGFEARHNSLT
jgi:hypothetical protein